PNIVLSAQGTTDPDSGQTGKTTFQWFESQTNPQSLNVGGATSSQVTIPKPTNPGEYFFTLIATDPDGNKDTTRSFFTILSDGNFRGGTLASIPEWARKGRMYEMFFKSMTPAGTIIAAQGYLPHLKSLGVNILWIMPIMENAATINNGTGPGYNIKNFYKVAPEYGTNSDFKTFVQQAHQLGLKVILDVTPNHTSYQHPFVLEAKQYRENSPYWNFYQHSFISHNTNGLGQSITADGFVYYSGFSSQLLNYNWSDIDARSYMVDVYAWWVKEFDIDGYRFDVYWGPHRRAGNGAGNENEMGLPVRRALKKIKPNIFLLAEDDGTGSGTEVIFGDRSGGADAGYDWILYGGAIKPFTFDGSSIENLHNKYYNNNFYPGINAAFLRFMENHDEERIAYQYGSYDKTMPMATTVFTVPGMPMIYSGQEVGMGPGISNFLQRTRGIIDWNSAGKNILLPHYQRLTHIRAQFLAFSTQQFVRIASGNNLVYAYSRPYNGGDGVVAVNFSPTQQNIALTLNSTNLNSTFQDGKAYFANDVYNDTSYSLQFNGGSTALSFRLKSYGSAVFVIADSLKRISLPTLVSVERDDSRSMSITDFRLYQNYPNPFNPSTTIQYEVPRESFVSLKIYGILGNEIATLEEGPKKQGLYTAQWNGRNQVGREVASGIYFARLQAGTFVNVKKMLLIR
ncbi:MAG: T9SS type A sorting domain-containing protein, partial [Ignavibacteriales bacterium]|nr:T9SS type A sorting domain-containing protein [Ignavibacteriales bacterium]